MLLAQPFAERNNPSASKATIAEATSSLAGGSRPLARSVSGDRRAGDFEA